MENKNIVIDADVLRSSGETVHPTSSASRNTLKAVLNSSCFAVINNELENEWKEHSSKMAVSWRAAMRSKNKIVRCCQDNIYHSIVHDSELDEGLRLIALKDSHLISLAINHDKIVTSNDDRARNAFCNLCDDRKELEQIYWVNVTKYSDEIIDSLSDKYKMLDDEHRLSQIE